VLRVDAVVELVWQDASGSTAATTLHAPSSLTVAEIDASVTTVASILASLTGCTLVATRIKYRSEPFPPVLLTGGSPITRTGIFFFSTGVSTPDALVSVPGIKDAVIVSSGPGEGVQIDITNSDVVTFANAVVDNGFSNPFADVFVALFAAYVQSRV
jgi:hypothetical protein